MRAQAEVRQHSVLRSSCVLLLRIGTERALDLNKMEVASWRSALLLTLCPSCGKRCSMSPDPTWNLHFLSWMFSNVLQSAVARACQARSKPAVRCHKEWIFLDTRATPACLNFSGDSIALFLMGSKEEDWSSFFSKPRSQVLFFDNLAIVTTSMKRKAFSRAPTPEKFGEFNVLA